MKIVRRKFEKGIGVALVFFLIIECLIRMAYFIRNSMVGFIPLPYGMASDYGPRPPWLENRRLLRPDPTLLWRGEPNLNEKYLDVFGPVHSEDELRSLRHQFFPKISTRLKSQREWTMSTNSEGFRDVEFPKEKPKGVFRIIVLGDSWTAGSNVRQSEAYPEQLKTLLKEQYPRANFEVFNLGVFGYTSFQGLKLLKTRAIDLQPDVVLIGFAMNESHMAGIRQSNGSETHPASLSEKIQTHILNLDSLLSENVEIYRLLRYWALMLKWKPQSIGEYLKIAVGQHSWYENGGSTQESWMKTALEDYEKYNTEMIDLARSRDADAILLYNEFWIESPYQPVLKKISLEKSVMLIDSSFLLANAKASIEKNLEAKLELKSQTARRASLARETEVIFRVYTGERLIPKAMYITGNNAKLGDLEPNKVAMYDDGTHGDQKAGDKVWSYSVSLPRGSTVYYVYTNSGKNGKWEGLDVPAIRSFKVNAAAKESTVYAPVDTFGEIYMHADAWHTNAAGNELIAQALLEVLNKDYKVKDYLQKVNDAHLQAPLHDGSSLNRKSTHNNGTARD